MTTRSSTRLVLALLCAGWGAGAPAAEPLDACGERVAEYAYYWDQADAEGLSQVFTEDATLDLAGQKFSGRAAIVERMLQNREGSLIRHLVSTVRIHSDAPGTASGVSYVTVYTSPRAESGLPSVDSFALIGEYHDQYRIGPDGCRIASRTLVPVLRGAPAP